MDPDARARFTAFAVSQGPPLHRLALLLNGGDWYDAQDAAQLALTAAYRHWGRVESADHPAAYVRRILVNGLAKRGTRRELSCDQPPEVANLDPELAAVEQQSAIATLLATLPLGQRAVIALRFALDLSEADTARELGISLGTVKSQTSKGLSTLRALRTLHPELAQEET